MRKLVFILAFVGITGNLLSQEYFKFPTSNALWNVLVSGSLSPPYEWQIIDSLGQEITIEDQQYIEVYSVGPGNGYVVGGIREDTLQKKIYFHDYSEEILLYDFDVVVGDIIDYPTLDYHKTVTDIYSININGQERKMIRLVNSLYSMPDFWIEGIGSVYRYGLLNPIMPYIVLDASTPYFGCFRHDDIVYIDDSTCYGGCPCSGWLVKINETENNDPGIRLFPNPTNNNISINLKNGINDYQLLEIYSCGGDLMVSKVIGKQELITLDLGSFSVGTYFVKLIRGNMVVVRKFVKE